RRALGHVQEWRQAHVADLEENWDRARRRQLLTPIAPLE
ncbi:MAG: transcriptional regulator, partial [Acidobacteria bacterium]